MYVCVWWCPWYESVFGSGLGSNHVVVRRKVCLSACVTALRSRSLIVWWYFSFSAETDFVPAFRQHYVRPQFGHCSLLSKKKKKKKSKTYPNMKSSYSSTELDLEFIFKQILLCTCSMVQKFRRFVDCSNISVTKRIDFKGGCGWVM